MIKKLILSAAVVAAIGAASFAAFNTYQHPSEFTDLELANIEALTDDEAGGFNCRWQYIGVGSLGIDEFHCLRNGIGNDCTCGDVHYGPQ